MHIFVFGSCFRTLAVIPFQIFALFFVLLCFWFGLFLCWFVCLLVCLFVLFCFVLLVCLFVVLFVCVFCKIIMMLAKMKRRNVGKESLNVRHRRGLPQGLGGDICKK